MRRSAQITVAGVAVAALGWGVWELAKWGVAITAAPETLGAPLLLAAAAP